MTNTQGTASGPFNVNPQAPAHDPWQVPATNIMPVANPRTYQGAGDSIALAVARATAAATALGLPLYIPTEFGGAPSLSNMNVTGAIPSGTYAQPLGSNVNQVKPSLLPFFNVKDYGAKGDGSTDDTTAIAAALAAVPAGGGRVYFPAGTYQVAGTGGNAFTPTTAGTILTGAGRNATTIRCTLTSQAIFSLGADHCVIEDMTLDTQTNNCQEAVSTANNYCGLRRCKVLGGSNIFALYFAGPVGATQASPTYNTGNFIEDLILNDQYAGDGLSWSFQTQSHVRDVIHTGSRISVFVCTDSLIEDYYYTPGVAGIGGNRNGFYITPPSQRVTIRNFNGLYGTLGNGPIIGASSTYMHTEVELDKVFVQGAGAANQNNSLTVNNAVDLKMVGVILESNAALVMTATTASGCDLTATACTIPQLAVTTASSSDPTTARFIGCKFPSFTNAVGQNANTFLNSNGVNGIAVQVIGGEADNASLVANFNTNGTTTSTVFFRGVKGVNPYLFPYAPAVPASNTWVNNLTGVDQFVYLSGFTMTTVWVAGAYAGSGGQSTGATPPTVVRVPAGGSITITYSVAGTWKWQGD